MKEIEEHIVSYIKQLSQDNQYILLSYAHVLFDEQRKEADRDVRLKKGKALQFEIIGKGEGHGDGKN